MWVVCSVEVRGEVGTRSRMGTYPHHPSYITHARSRTHFTPYLPNCIQPT